MVKNKANATLDKKQAKYSMAIPQYLFYGTQAGSTHFDCFHVRRAGKRGTHKKSQIQNLSNLVKFCEILSNFVNLVEIWSNFPVPKKSLFLGEKSCSVLYEVHINATMADENA